jgi:hypothetical protein
VHRPFVPALFLDALLFPSALLFLSALQLIGCQTYRDDLNRGQRYYEDNQYAQALALFRSLEQDTDSLSTHEQARYAYFRGMTDYRLARVEGGNDERFDRYARYWLGLASAINSENPGGLQEHEKKRLTETLTDLNNKAYGISDQFDGQAAPATPSEAAPADGAVPADGAPVQPGGDTGCKVSTDCPDDHICQDGACIQL